MFALPVFLLSMILPFHPTVTSIPFLDNYHGFMLTFPPTLTHNATAPLIPAPETADMRFGFTLLFALFIPTQLLLIVTIRQLSTIRLSYLAIEDVHQGFFGTGFGDTIEWKGNVGPGMYWYLKWQRGWDCVLGAIVNAFFYDLCTGLVLLFCCVVWKIVEMLKHGPNHTKNVGNDETASGSANYLPFPLLVLLSVLIVVMLIEISLRIRFLFALRAMKRRLF